MRARDFLQGVYLFLYLGGLEILLIRSSTSQGDML